MNNSFRISFIIFLSIVAIIMIIYNLGNPYIRANYTSTKFLKKSVNNNKSQHIPLHIMMTTYDKSKIPKKVYEMLNKYATVGSKPIPYTIWNDSQCIDFLKKHYKRKIVNKFNQLTGAHKADLFRYCYLYINGGIYMDIKTQLVKPLSDVIDLSIPNRMYTVLGAGLNNILLSSMKMDATVENLNLYNIIYQGLIITPPNNNIMLILINMCMHTPLYTLRINYLLFVHQMYDVLKYNSKNNTLIPGNNRLSSIDCYLLEEKLLNHCDIRDRYGHCSAIYDKDNLVCLTRWADYPWK